MVAPRTVDFGRPATEGDLIDLLKKLGKDDEGRVTSLAQPSGPTFGPPQREEPAAYTRASIPSSEPVASYDPPQEPTPAREDPAGLFDPEALLKPLPGRCEWYTMPAGGRVCVHPVSQREAEWINRQALREVRAEGLIPEDNDPHLKEKLEEASQAANFRAQVWQVVTCCRKGEGLTDEAVFQPAYAKALRCNPGYVRAIEDIVRISNGLGQGKAESAVLREVFAGFFGEMASWLETFAGQLTPETLASSQDALTRFAAIVSAMKQPEPSSLPKLPALQQQP